MGCLLGVNTTGTLVIDVFPLLLLCGHSETLEKLLHLLIVLPWLSLMLFFTLFTVVLDTCPGSVL